MRWKYISAPKAARLWTTKSFGWLAAGAAKEKGWENEKL
jgi:hypothetical protein